MSDSHDAGPPPPRPGAVVRLSNGEPTLVGVETAAELEQRAAVAVAVHRIWVRRMAVRALLILVGRGGAAGDAGDGGRCGPVVQRLVRPQLLGVTLGPSFRGVDRDRSLGVLERWRRRMMSDGPVCRMHVPMADVRPISPWGDPQEYAIIARYDHVRCAPVSRQTLTEVAVARKLGPGCTNGWYRSRACKCHKCGAPSLAEWNDNRRRAAGRNRASAGLRPVRAV
jgi:hypothetical protein